MERFKGPMLHRPLSESDPTEIRVIRLNLKSSDDDIEADLCHISLQKSNAKEVGYIAVSYVWGDPEQTRNIRLNGSEFPVTINLYNALKRIRKECKLIMGGEADWFPLWIDALCINQLDLAERACQVTRMFEIYDTANAAAAYVGEPEAGDEIVLAILT